MTFFDKNEDNLETLVFSLTKREKTTIAIGIYDCDDTCDKAIAYVSQQLKDQPTLYLDLFGQKTDSLLAFFRERLPKNTEQGLPIVHLTKLDPLLFTVENHKVISSPLVAQINMERELLFHELNALIVLWMTRAGYNRLRMDAPDFMDWVVASFVFENEDETNIQKLSVEIPKETIDDRSKATIHLLREKAKKLQQRTVKFEQGTKQTIKNKKEYFNLLLALIDAYKDLHDLENAQKTLEKTYALAKENNLADGFEFGKLLFNLGDTEHDLGNLDKALTLFEEALQHFELLEDKESIAVCFQRLGDMHMNLGDLDKALDFFKKDTELSQELLAAHPDNVSYEDGLAISYSKLGQAHIRLGNLDKALELFEESNRLEKELYTTYPNNVGFKNNLAISYQYLGNTYTRLGFLDKALTLFEKYNHLIKELYIKYPNNVLFKDGLAVSYQYLGNTHSSLGDFNKALESFEELNKLFKELYAAYPNNVNFKNGLAISYWQLGETYKKSEKIDAMLGAHENSNRLCKELFTSFPQNVNFKNNLAESYLSLGRCLVHTDKIKAKTHFQHAEKLWKELVHDAPGYVQFQRFLNQIQEEIASLSPD